MSSLDSIWLSFSRELMRKFFSIFTVKCHRRELARTMMHGISTRLNDFNSVRLCATSCFAVRLLSVLAAINLRFFDCASPGNAWELSRR